MFPHPLTPAETALARRGAYDLLGRLFLDGPDILLLPRLYEVEALAAVLPPAGEIDADGLAAGHYALFGLNLFPHAAIFLDESGLLGGEIPAGVSALLGGVGYPAEGTTADHLGHYLRALAHVCAAEADAHADDLPRVAAQMAGRQHEILEDLARWVWPLLAAIELQPDPLYQTAAHLTASLLLDHIPPRPPTPESRPPAVLPDPESFLKEAGTSLRDIAHYLLIPVHSGWFLSREAITDIGRALDLPRGFGGREQMLTNLLRTAGQYEALPALVDALQEVRGRWAGRYDSYAVLAGRPALLTPWQERLGRTGALLELLRTAALGEE